MRRAALVLAAALAVSGCGEDAEVTSPGPPPTVAPSTPRSAAPEPSATPASAACPVGGLLLLAGPTDAALGLRVTPVQALNCGTAPVTVSGYPDLVVYQDGGPAKPYTTVRGGTMVDEGPTTVVLKPGQRAWSSLAWRNTVEDIGLDPIEGDTIVVRDLGGVTQDVPAVVDLGTTGRVEITAWQRGRPQARS